VIHVLTDFSLAPEEQLRAILTFYYSLGLNDKKVALECIRHFPQEEFGLRCVHLRLFSSTSTQVGPLGCGWHSSSTVKRLRRKWDLKSTRQQKHTFESIMPSVAEIRRRFPTRGAENIRKNLRQEYGMRVSRYDLHTIYCEFVINP
jgi:hypothetical protein